MKSPAGKIDIFLHPGDLYFGDSSIRIRTILGSCVSVTMWHPVRKIGGMCHIVLPGKANPDERSNIRYADDAIEGLLRAAIRAKSRPGDYQIKLFGGGSMFCSRESGPESRVAYKNVESARKILAHHGLSVMAENVGSSGHRCVFFEVWSGHVWVRHQPIAK